MELKLPEEMQSLRPLRPRVLTFGLSPENDNIKSSSCLRPSYLQSNLLTVSPTKKQQITCSPPYRKVRALRLFDSPTTPKTIIQKSSIAKLLKLQKTEQLECDQTKIEYNADESDTNKLNTFYSIDTADRPTVVHLHNKTLDNAANVNPFTPNSLSMQNKKRSRTTAAQQENERNYSMTNMKNKSRRPIASLFSNYVDNQSSEDESNNDNIVQAPKRLALQDSNISRYKKEFVELSLIGAGEFGYVYRCLNRLDGCEYAIKKSIKPVAGSIFEKTALNEVWAHAVLGKHDNVVRYYSAWAENNHMVIQNEYCNGSSLQTVLQKRNLVESELRTLLTHIAGGLKYIHSNDLVHMDIKAGNIFMSKLPLRTQSNDGCDDDGFEDIYDYLDNEELVVYKIGDLGHVTSVNNPQVEEGDCRYLPNEILQEDFTQLFKADIFALGITLYEAAGGGPLPKNGPEWHMLRDGNIPDLPRLSREFNDLIKLMTHPNPHQRPSSTSIFRHPFLCPLEIKSKAQLSHELNIERQKNEILMRKLREQRSILKAYEQSNSTPSGKRGRNSPAASSSDRKLRSCVKKCSAQKSTKMSSRGRASFRDQNKNVVGNFEFYR